MSNVKLSGRGLVIRLDAEHIRVALMNLGAAVPHIIASVEAPMPPGAVEDGAIIAPAPLREALRAILADPQLRRARRCVMSICSTQIIGETAVVPALSEKKLARLIEANTDVYFPVPVDTGSYRLVWTPVGPEKDENGQDAEKIQLWAVPRALLAPYYALANDCGLTVAAVDYCGAGLVRALDRVSYAAPAAKKPAKKKKSAADGPAVAVAEGDSEVTLYLCADAEHLMMTFVREGQVRLQRLLLRGQYRDELGEARIVREYFASQPGEHFDSLRVIACGELTGETDYLSALDGAFGVSTELWESQLPAQWFLHEGAARAVLDFGAQEMNSRPTASDHLKQAWQYVALLGCGLALVAALLLNYGSKLVWTATVSGLESNVRALELQEAQNRGYAQNFRNYESAYSAYASDWTTVYANLRTYNDNLSRMLGEIETILPESSSVITIGIAGEGMALEFACPSKEEAAYLIIALRELEYADLIAISDLTVGQGTTAQNMLPALSQYQAQLAAYAQASAGTEAAPTKGGTLDYGELYKLYMEMIASGEMDAADVAKWLEIYQKATAATGSTDPEEIFHYALESGLITEEMIVEQLKGLDEEQLQYLLQAYGTAPSVRYTLDELLADASYDQRCNALRTMLTDNPIALAQFYYAFKADMYAEKSLLFSTIAMDLLTNEEIMSAMTAPNLDALEAALPALLDILTASETNLTATENLIRSDKNLTGWYTYYLADEMELLSEDEKSDSPIIDIDQIIDDIVNGPSDDTPNKDEVGEILDDLVGELLPELPETGGETSGGSTDIDWDKILGLIGGETSGGETSGGETSGDALQDLINQWMGGGTTGGETTGQQQPADTRYHFAVTLAYRQALRDAELERKGLPAVDSMLGKLEVDG